MTHEELKKSVNDVNEYYRKQIEELESKKKSFIQQLMNDWANENSEFKVGDIIESNMNVIKITRKDGSTFTIYGNKGR